jgi:hypothetical protein
MQLMYHYTSKKKIKCQVLSVCIVRFLDVLIDFCRDQ